jgi:hypothetical protein
MEEKSAPGAGRGLSMDVIMVIFDNLELPLADLAPYRRCCRAMSAYVVRTVKRFDASTAPRSRRSDDGAWLRSVVEVYGRLEELQCGGLTLSDDAGVLSAGLGGGRLPNLRVLDLFDSVGVTDAAVLSLSGGCPRLRVLTLGGSLRRHGARLTNAAVDAVSLRCLDLDALHLHCCYQVTDAAVALLAQSRGPALRAVTLSRCGKVTDASVLALAAAAPNLQSVNVRVAWMGCCCCNGLGRNGARTVAFRALSRTLLFLTLCAQALSIYIYIYIYIFIY